MSDLEDGEILDSSDEEMKNDTQKGTKIKADVIILSFTSLLCH